LGGRDKRIRSWRPVYIVRLCLKNKIQTKGLKEWLKWLMECLPKVSKVLGSILTTSKKEKERKNNNKRKALLWGYK
jgi:hypothetical protein